jgi:MOSC domain-containing protein YiiM
VRTAIWKAPVDGRVWARGEQLDGDVQADRQVHGGPSKALYAYAVEDYRWWAAQLGRELGPGTFGENLTVAGLELAGAVVGERKVVLSELAVIVPVVALVNAALAPFVIRVVDWALGEAPASRVGLA